MRLHDAPALDISLLLTRFLSYSLGPTLVYYLLVKIIQLFIVVLCGSHRLCLTSRIIS